MRDSEANLLKKINFDFQNAISYYSNLTRFNYKHLWYTYQKGGGASHPSSYKYWGGKYKFPIKIFAHTLADCGYGYKITRRHKMKILHDDNDNNYLNRAVSYCWISEWRKRRQFSGTPKTFSPDFWFEIERIFWNNLLRTRKKTFAYQL